MVITRSQLYGDHFFETIAVRDGMVAHLHFHLERIQKSLLLFKMEGHYDIRHLEQDIHQSLGDLKDARIRVVFFRYADGLYRPDRLTFQTEVSVSPLPQEVFSIETAGVFTAHQKPMTHFSALKNPFAYLSVLASIHANQLGWNDAILLNTSGRVCETIAGNIFMVHDGVVYTPSEDEGCIHGVMRKVIIETLQKAGMPIVQMPIEVSFLEKAHEVFTSNTIHRMSSIHSLNGYTYGQSMTDRIRKLLQAL